MRLLKRNTQTVYYKLPDTTTMQQDADGLYNGAITVNYGGIASVQATITNAGGVVEYAEYGITEKYTKRMLVDDVKCSIEKDTLLWIGVDPNIIAKPNYRVLKKDPLINNVSYLLKEIT